MQIDDTLVSKILMQVEQLDGLIEQLSIEGYAQETVNDHVDHLRKTGFLEANEPIFPGDGPIANITIKGLTGPGYEKLRALKAKQIKVDGFNKE